MLDITGDAARICSESVRQLSLLAASRLPRVSKDDDGGVSIALETPADDDDIVYHDGSPVLAVPTEITDEVSELTLDVSDEGVFVLT